MPKRGKQFFYPSQTSWPVIGIASGEGIGGGGSTVAIVVTDGRGEITVPSGAFTLTIDGDDYELDTADILGQRPLLITDTTIANDDDDSSGTITVGDTLTATAGVLIYDPAGGSPLLAYSWERDAVEVETDADRVVVSGDITYGLIVYTTATNGYGASLANEVTAIVAAPYTEVGTTWDGSNNRLQSNAALAGVSNAKTGLIFDSFYRASDAPDYMMLLSAPYVQGFNLEVFGNEWKATAFDLAESQVVEMKAGSVSKGQRYSVLAAFNADGTSRLWVRGASSWSEIATDATGGGADFKLTGTDWRIGERYNGSDKFKGNHYRTAMWTGMTTMPDVTDSAFLNLFVDPATGLTKDPAISIAAMALLGGVHAMEFYGNAAVINAGTNRAPGGTAFTMAGTVVDV